MPGPCSLPNGSRAEWNEMNEIVCDVHRECELDKDTCQPVVYRLWLAKRNRLRTGKTK